MKHYISGLIIALSFILFTNLAFAAERLVVTHIGNGIYKVEEFEDKPAIVAREEMVKSKTWSIKEKILYIELLEDSKQRLLDKIDLIDIRLTDENAELLEMEKQEIEAEINKTVEESIIEEYEVVN